ncbi:hypothetical protein B0A51_18995 [Rachicladosporium sp. CCFEE 5018]|nr:hypothetical protein B0A51_18995 [Rachicladosporium sp. CCFEE 5018]OQO17809.1 hypothetical protein B0A51_14947 [Rachicladosporium sp. CCFEE 5018]
MPSYLVTGASRGLGLAFVIHLASIADNTVIGLVRNKEASEAKVPSELKDKIHFIQADITDASILQAAAKETAAITGGSLDVLINNAAYVDSPLKKLDDFSPEELSHEFSKSFSTNVTSVALTINAFLPLIRKGALKKVVTISTGLADIDLTVEYDLYMTGVYSTSKAATNMLVAKYHASLGKSEGILFFSLSPGLVDTPEGRNVPSSQDQAIMGEMGQKFGTYAPHFAGPITPEQSVRLQMEVIGKATVETQGGAFISQFGNKKWL